MHRTEKDRVKESFSILRHRLEVAMADACMTGGGSDVVGDGTVIGRWWHGCGWAWHADGSGCPCCSSSGGLSLGLTSLGGEGGGMSILISSCDASDSSGTILETSFGRAGTGTLHGSSSCRLERRGDQPGEFCCQTCEDELDPRSAALAGGGCYELQKVRSDAASGAHVGPKQRRIVENCGGNMGRGT
ncbi:hypothetical protein CCACVL1_06639 [Corchorus capsularis]|uniref:Uncharacterized protein n=1 Tax=Corchorus capsularis TaxID=210143 RepID=A0A1R3JE31_COCAP|nr:hypothetical protein CCACVL1_06639 [Corchorus capsularis]